MIPLPVRCPVDRRSAAMRLLAGPDYADAYAVRLRPGDRRGLDGLLHARGSAVLERWLGRCRDILVAPWQLKPIGSTGMAPFEVRLLTDTEAAYGIDDHHLDVCVSYHLVADPSGRRLVATTAVRLHNRFGHCYLRAILPFHRLIVMRQLRRIVSADLDVAP